MDEATIKTMIKPALPSTTTIESISPVTTIGSSSSTTQGAPLPSRSLIEARISDGSTLLISFPPPPMVKLLRSERDCINSEAAVLAWLAQAGVGTGLHGIGQGPARGTASSSPPSSSPILLLTSSGHMEATPPSMSGDKTRCHVASSEVHAAHGRPEGYLPQLVSHSTEIALTTPGATSLVRPSAGTPLCALSPAPTSSERAALNYQTGSLLRRLSKLESPSGKFGPALGVLQGAGLAPTTSLPRRSNARGSDTWSVAFATLFEDLLRDAEDVQLTLSYTAIRKKIKLFETLLDAVSTPRFVVVTVGDEDNTLALRTQTGRAPPRASHPSGAKASRHPGSKGKARDTDANAKRKARARQKSTSNQSSADRNNSPRDGDGQAAAGGTDIAVSGLRDLGNCVFGDPLFAKVFSPEQQSAELWDGFGTALDGEPVDALGVPQCLIEDWSNAKTRTLLYECYHAITRLVSEFYRPSKGSSKRELEARKWLNHVLAKLDAAHQGLLKDDCEDD